MHFLPDAVGFRNGIYVPRCFQKKSRKGIETSREDMDMIEARLKLARAHSEGAGHEHD